MSIQDLVREFHQAYDVTIQHEPKLPDTYEEELLRRDLLEEEFDEFKEAQSLEDLVGIADALADMAYIIYGTALVYGINLDAVVREVHRSNMTKLGADGQPIRRSDGKVLKGPLYSPPNIEGVLGLDDGLDDYGVPHGVVGDGES